MRDDIQDALTTLENAVTDLQVEITTLQRRKDRLQETLKYLREQYPVTPARRPYSVEKRVRITEMGARSQTHSHAFYVIECYMIRGGAEVGGIRDYLVLTCSCPAFKFSEGDQWSGRRKWCKHIRANFYEVTNRSVVARCMERENLPIIGGDISYPIKPSLARPARILTNRSR